jgi:hypothetical protein
MGYYESICVNSMLSGGLRTPSILSFVHEDKTSFIVFYAHISA